MLNTKQLSLNKSIIVLRTLNKLSLWMPSVSDYIALDQPTIKHLAGTDLPTSLDNESVKYGFLIENSKQKDMPSDLQKHRTRATNDHKLNVTDAYTLINNFAMWPNPSGAGWQSWNYATQNYLDLPLHAIELINSLTEELSVERLSGNQLEILLRLVEARLVITTEEKHAHERRGDETQAKTSSTLTAVKADEIMWLPQPKPNVDNRIPVYFIHSQFSNKNYVGERQKNTVKKFNYLPLALGMIFAYLKDYQHGVLIENFFLIEDFITNQSDLRRLAQHYGPGIALFSDYEWNLDFNMDLSRELKEISPDFICIHGGPSAPKYEGPCRDFMEVHPHVDIVARGEGEQTTAELLMHFAPPKADQDSLALSEIKGISYRSEHRLVTRTPDRPRIRDLSILPSPYLSGVFDWADGSMAASVTIETNRGCPFGCTFCDWGSAINQKVFKFDMDRVAAEIEWLANRNFGMIWCADANFGAFMRDKEIAKMIANAKRKYGSPRQFIVNYAKNTTRKVADIVETLCDADIQAQGVIAIQSMDSGTLKAINRSNIKTKSYEALVDVFSEKNIPLTTDLMMALPGATVASFKADLRHFFALNTPVKAFLTRVLPNSPMADKDYIKRYQIKQDAQGFIASTSSFSAAEREEMVQMYQAYRTLADGIGLLKYVLKFLDWDYALDPIDFIHELSTSPSTSDYPTLLWAINCAGGHRTSPCGWRRLFDEFSYLVYQKMGLEHIEGLDTVLLVQSAILPDQNRSFPHKIKLPHDFVAYFQDRLQGGKQPLIAYPPGELNVTDPSGICMNDPSVTLSNGGHLLGEWELESELKQYRSVVHRLKVSGGQSLSQGPLYTFS